VVNNTLKRERREKEGEGGEPGDVGYDLPRNEPA